MSSRNAVGSMLALACVIQASAAEQTALLLRYKPVSPLSYVTVKGGAADRIVVMTIDSSESVADKDQISMDFRVADISLKGRNPPRRTTMSSRGEILDVLVGGRRARGRRRRRLPEGVEEMVSERLLYGGMGFPLLPVEEVRPGDTWEETFHLAKVIGEGVLFIPIKATYTYRGDVTLQKRNCAMLSFRLSGELEVPGEGGGTIRIEVEGGLAFDYENGCDVESEKRIVQEEIPASRGERPRREVTTVVRRLSEVPLLGPPHAGPEKTGAPE